MQQGMARSMIVNLNKTMAFRCPYCGEITFAPISLFELCSNKGIAIRCACGQGGVAIKTENRVQCSFQLSCIFCDDVHTFRFTVKELMQKKLKEFFCPEFGFDLAVAFIGNAGDVADRIEDSELFLSELSEELSNEEMGSNTIFLLKAIEKIRSFAAEGNIRCECGSNTIDVDVAPNTLFLVCEQCGNVLPLTVDAIKGGLLSQVDGLVIPAGNTHPQ